jgi:uncharacterized protein YeaO (DUF488 family)
MIALKRVYETPSRQDGIRILVERLWPRGLRKEDARLDLWLKEIAPSAGLRKWFGHDPARWKQFQKRYTAELERKNDLVGLIRRQAQADKVTLVYAARDEAHNSALALKQFLSRRQKGPAAKPRRPIAIHSQPAARRR